jgi:hypothetical protein
MAARLGQKGIIGMFIKSQNALPASWRNKAMSVKMTIAQASQDNLGWRSFLTIDLMVKVSISLLLSFLLLFLFLVSCSCSSP